MDKKQWLKGKVFTFHPKLPAYELPVLIGECLWALDLAPQGQGIPDYRLCLQGKSGRKVEVELLKHWCFYCRDWLEAEARKQEILKRHFIEPEDFIQKRLKSKGIFL